MYLYSNPTKEVCASFWLQMPRNRQRSTTRKSWDLDTLEKSIKYIDEGGKTREAARKFGIPESTLRDQKKKKKEDRLSSTLGRNPIFTKEQETEIADHVMKLAKLFYGVTPIQLRKIAYDFASINNIPNNFDTNTKLAGKDWLYLFLKRNPILRLRQPEGTSLNRIRSFNEQEVTLFFTNLENVFKKHSFPANRVFNQDESGISIVQKRSAKIYAAKGQKQVGIATSAERGKNITVVCCMSASGGYIPPMIIYPRKRMASVLQVNGPIGAIYHCSDNGWINEDLFVVWLKHFHKAVKPTVDDPVLLVCDNHGSHSSLEAYEFCRSNYITIVSLPPHTSNRLQPLDLTFFGPLKNALYREYDLFMAQNHHTAIEAKDIASLFNKAYTRVAAIDKAVSGFRAAGIVPLDPHKFSAEDFAPAKEFQEIVVEQEEEENVETSTIFQQRESAPSTSEIPRQTKSSSSRNSLALLSEPVPSTSGTSHQTRSVLPSNLSPPPDPFHNVSSISPPECSPTGVSTIAPIPKHNENRKIKKANAMSARRQHSVVFTSTPQKIKLEEKKEKRLKRLQNKKAKSVRKKLKMTDTKQKNKQKESSGRKNIEVTDESDLSIDTDELCDDDDVMDDDLIGQDNSRCLICDEFGQDGELWFRCVLCGFWCHSECSGVDGPEDFKCDICVKKGKKI